MKLLLMGNPNVGKSVVFSRLTGLNAVSSNYAGTTISFTKGNMELDGNKVELIDVPGTYTLNPTNEAEKVAVQLIPEGDIILNVIDATNLERNLFLTMQLLSFNKPMILVLNMWDETKHKGIDINIEKLEELLGIPVVPTSAISGEGIKLLHDKIPQAKKSQFISTNLENLSNETIWEKIGLIVPQVQKLHHHHHTFLQILQEISVKPITGFPFALLILYLSFLIIRFIGEGLINYVFDPFFTKAYLPLIMKLSAFLGPQTFVHKILIGKLINGQVDFFQSFGVLTSGFYVPIAAVLPYVIAFYFMLTILEDTGYLPRLAVLMDSFFHKIGLHGYAIIPTLLGLGCNVPAIMGTRILDSKRDRFIASTLISVSVPCTAMQAMIFGILGRYGFKVIFMAYFVLFLVWLIVGFSLNKIMKGFSPELLIEIPPYRFPPLAMLFKKLYFRIKGFLIEAVPIVLIGIFFVNILYILHLFDIIANITAPIFKHLLGLPKEAVIGIVLGFLRKDIAMGMLVPLQMNLHQLFVSTIVLAMTFPCIATFTVMLKELGVKYLIYSMSLMISLALIVGTILNYSKIFI